MRGAPKEEAIQKWLVNEIERSNSLANVIQGGEALEDAAAALKDQEWLPEFPLDSLARRELVAGAAWVFKQLKFVRIVSAVRDISKSAGERLYPDLVLLNPETNVIVILEIKRSGQAEREAITELLAYEQEVLNHLPFASPVEVCFALVSTDFSPLLAHAVAGAATWQRRRVLCLALDFTNKRPACRPVLPAAWSPFGPGSMDPNSLVTITTGIVPKEEGQTSVVGLELAFERLVRDAERLGATGFALLWEDVASPSAPLSLTLVALSPYAFIRVAAPEERDNPLLSALREYQGDIPSFPASIWMLADGFRDSLQSADLYWEGMMSWPMWLDQHQKRAHPIHMDFWGVLGDAARTFVTSPTIREELAPDLAATGRSWTDPLVGLWFLDVQFGRALARGGVFTCQSMFRIGVLLGALRSIINSISDNTGASKRYLETAAFWTALELLAGIRQILLRARLAPDIKLPKGFKVSLSGRRKKRTVSALSDFILWLDNSFLADSPIHRELFRKGVDFHDWFHEALRPYAEGEPPLAGYVRSLLDVVLGELERNGNPSHLVAAIRTSEQIGGRLDRRSRISFRGVKQASRSWADTAILNALPGPILALADLITPPVFHDIRHPVILPKGMVQELRYLHRLYSVDRQIRIIQVAADGSVGLVEETLVPRHDPETHVGVRVDLAGLGVLRLHRWEELEAGVDVAR